jgi:hypothetical protein
VERDFISSVPDDAWSHCTSLAIVYGAVRFVKCVSGTMDEPVWVIGSSLDTALVGRKLVYECVLYSKLRFLLERMNGECNFNGEIVCVIAGRS